MAMALATALVFAALVPVQAAPFWAGEEDEGFVPPGLAGPGGDALERHRERLEARLAELEGRALENMQRLFGFDDMDEAVWALPYVARVRLANLMVGRGPDTFAPNQPVKRAEVITVAVRMLDEAEADVAADLAFGVNGVEWAEDWLAIGAALDLYDNDANFRPNAAAQREWVAHVLVRVLEAAEYDFGDVDEADLIEFVDHPSISAEYWDDLALAVGLKIFTGYPNGTLQPRGPITRAEFAAVLARMENLLDIDLELEDDLAGLFSVEGVIVAIQTDSITVAVDGDEENEDEPTYDLDEDTEVWINDDHIADADELAVGDAVQLWVDADGLAVYIFATVDLTPVEGTYRDMVLPGDDPGYIEIDVDVNVYTYEIRDTTDVACDFRPQEGDPVALMVRGDRAFSVEIEPAEDFPAYRGIILAIEVENGELTLTLVIDEEDLTFAALLNEVDLYLDDAEIGNDDIDDIEVGYEAEVRVRVDGEDEQLEIMWAATVS